MIEMSVKTVKSLMAKELLSHYRSACQNCHHEVQRAFIHRGYHNVIEPTLDAAESYEDLEEILSLMDYKMSLQDWIDSL
jgi:ATP phosphoribosyltransferase regulatory subunit HisZ